MATITYFQNFDPAALRIFLYECAKRNLQLQNEETIFYPDYYGLYEYAGIRDISKRNSSSSSIPWFKREVHFRGYCFNCKKSIRYPDGSTYPLEWQCCNCPVQTQNQTTRPNFFQLSIVSSWEKMERSIQIEFIDYLRGKRIS